MADSRSAESLTSPHPLAPYPNVLFEKLRYGRRGTEQKNLDLLILPSPDSGRGAGGEGKNLDETKV
jgi:hypothetical protein